MSDVTASICIRGWRRNTLPRAIASVLEQGRDDIEVIVGDDAGDLADVVAGFDDGRVLYRRNSARARANLRVRRRRVRAALRDVRAARQAAPRLIGKRGLVALLGARPAAARLLARHPRFVEPAFFAWRTLQRLDRIG